MTLNAGLSEFLKGEGRQSIDFHFYLSKRIPSSNVTNV